MQQALRQGNVIKGHDDGFLTINAKIKVMNFPLTHDEDMIRKVCEVFAKIRTVEMIRDQMGRFTGSVMVECEDELEAKRAQSNMMGFRIQDCVLDVKKITIQDAQPQSVDGEMFKQLIEDKPTACLCLKNVVVMSEIENRIDYKELEFDVEDEMIRYGKVIKVVVPRPPLYGDPYQMPGFGRVYVRFREVDDAKRAKEALIKRRFNGRMVEAVFYPEDRFIKSIWG